MYFCAKVSHCDLPSGGVRCSIVSPSPTSIGKSSPARQTTFHGAGSW